MVRVSGHWGGAGGMTWKTKSDESVAGHGWGLEGGQGPEYKTVERDIEGWMMTGTEGPPHLRGRN